MKEDQTLNRKLKELVLIHTSFRLVLYEYSELLHVTRLTPTMTFGGLILTHTYPHMNTHVINTVLSLRGFFNVFTKYSPFRSMFVVVPVRSLSCTIDLLKDYRRKEEEGLGSWIRDLPFRPFLFFCLQLGGISPLSVT